MACALQCDYWLCSPIVCTSFLFSIGKGGTTGLFGSTAVVLRAGRNYEAGEEFFVSYGPKGAAGYLEENGCARAFGVALFATAVAATVFRGRLPLRMFPPLFWTTRTI